MTDAVKHSEALLRARWTYEAVCNELDSADRGTAHYCLLSNLADDLLAFISGMELLEEAQLHE